MGSRFIKLLTQVTTLEKKYKLITYCGLLFLTISNLSLRNDYLKLKDEFTEVKEANNKLISDMVFFNRTFEDFPWAVFQKVKRGNKFIMQYVNPAYVKTFLKHLNKDRYSYMGKSDFEIYNRQTALEYHFRDLQVNEKGGSHRFLETYIDSVGNRQFIDVLKWRIIERKDTLIYGMIIPVKEYPKRIK